MSRVDRENPGRELDKDAEWPLFVHNVGSLSATKQGNHEVLISKLQCGQFHLEMTKL